MACALLALAIPLTAGMARGAIVPGLRINEVLLLVVTAGLVLRHLTRAQPLAYARLDVVILGFCLINLVVPWAVILLSRVDAALDVWQTVLAPAQYLCVYLVYSRGELDVADVSLVFHACMLASVLVAAVAVAEAIDVAGVRDAVANYYPPQPLAPGDTVYRPASLLGHYSAVGAFGLLNLVLAIAIAAARLPGFPRWWLGLAAGASLLSVVVSVTYAPMLALSVGVGAALLVVRKVPWWQLAVGLPVLAAAAVALWPSISARAIQQVSGAGGNGLPDSIATRVDYWQSFFVPALLRHGLWFGTGTLMPPEVPGPLVNFVDNGYLWQLFRAGVPGLVAFLVMLGSIAAVAWATRSGESLVVRVLGAVCLGAVVSIVILDTSSEYLTFTGVSQEFWMLAGLLSGAALGWRSSVPVTEADEVIFAPTAGQVRIRLLRSLRLTI